MSKINLNALAKTVTESEGLKKNLSIAQVEEVIRIALDELAFEYERSEVLELLERVEEYE